MELKGKFILFQNGTYVFVMKFSFLLSSSIKMFYTVMMNCEGEWYFQSFFQ